MYIATIFVNHFGNEKIYVEPGESDVSYWIEETTNGTKYCHLYSTEKEAWSASVAMAMSED